MCVYFFKQKRVSLLILIKGTKAQNTREIYQGEKGLKEHMHQKLGVAENNFHWFTQI